MRHALWRLAAQTFGKALKSLQSAASHRLSRCFHIRITSVQSDCQVFNQDLSSTPIAEVSMIEIVNFEVPGPLFPLRRRAVESGWHWQPKVCSHRVSSPRQPPPHKFHGWKVPELPYHENSKGSKISPNTKVVAAPFSLVQGFSVRSASVLRNFMRQEIRPSNGAIDLLRLSNAAHIKYTSPSLYPSPSKET